MKLSNLAANKSMISALMSPLPPGTSKLNRSNSDRLLPIGRPIELSSASL